MDILFYGIALKIHTINIPVFVYEPNRKNIAANTR